MNERQQGGEKNTEPIEVTIGKLLKAKNRTVATAESCTGGLVADRLTDVPGSSAYVRGGIVAYVDAVKMAALGVKRETLAKFTAVSAAVAEEMALGAIKSLDVDYGVATTGLAGPDGDGTGRPVGLVYTAVAYRDGRVAIRENYFSGTRREIKTAAAQTALMMLREFIE